MNNSSNHTYKNDDLKKDTNLTKNISLLSTIDKSKETLKFTYQSKPTLDPSIPTQPNYKMKENYDEMQQNELQLNIKYNKDKFKKHQNKVNNIMGKEKEKLVRDHMNKKVHKKLRDEKIEKQDNIIDKNISENINIFNSPDTKNTKLNYSPRHDYQNRLATNNDLQDTHNHKELQRQNLSAHQQQDFVVQSRFRSVDLNEKKKKRKIQDNVPRSKLKLIHESQFKQPESEWNDLKHRKMQLMMMKADKDIQDDIITYNNPDQQLVSQSLKNLITVKNIINVKKKQLDFKAKLSGLHHSADLKSQIAQIKSINESKNYYEDQLKIIDLSNNNLTLFDEDSHKLLTQCMKRLLLNDCKLNLTSLTNICNSLIEIKITRLSMNNVSLSQSSWNEFFSKLILRCNSIVRLDVSGNPMSEIGIQGLERLIERDSQIATLNLSDCQIDFSLFKSIIRALFLNHKLKILNMSKNNLGKQKEYDLLKIRDMIQQQFANNKTLCHLDLSENYLPPAVNEAMTLSIMSRHTFIFLHTNETGGRMFDQLAHISQDFVDKYRRSTGIRLTACSACDNNIIREINFQNESLEGKDEVSVQVHLEQYDFSPILMNKMSAQSYKFIIKLQLPNTPIRFQFSTTEQSQIENFIEDKNEQFKCPVPEEHKKQMEEFWDVYQGKINYEELQKVDEDKPIFKLTNEIEIPQFYKKPFIPEKQEKETTDITFKNNYFKLFEWAKIARKCGIQDINNLSIFQYLNQNLRINEKLTIKFLQMIADNYLRFIDLQKQLICISCRDQNPEQQITRRSLYLFYQKVKMLHWEIIPNSFENICKNIQEQREDSSSDLRFWRKDFLDFNVHLFIFMQFYKDRRNFHLKQMDQLNMIAEQLPFNFQTFKDTIKNKRSIFKAFNVNKAIFTALYHENTSKEAFITVIELWTLVKKLEVNISQSEFHWHILSTVILTETEHINGRNFKLDIIEFGEFMQKLFYYHPDQFLEKIDFNYLKDMFKLNRRLVLNQISNQYLDNLEWLIMLFSHILLKYVTTDRWKYEILDQFGENNTIRFYTEVFYRYNVHESEAFFTDLSENAAKAELTKLSQKFEKRLSEKRIKDKVQKMSQDSDSSKMIDTNINGVVVKDITQDTILYFDFEEHDKYEHVSKQISKKLKSKLNSIISNKLGINTNSISKNYYELPDIDEDEPKQENDQNLDDVQKIPEDLKENDDNDEDEDDGYSEISSYSEDWDGDIQIKPFGDNNEKDEDLDQKKKKKKDKRKKKKKKKKEKEDYKDDENQIDDYNENNDNNMVNDKPNDLINNNNIKNIADLEYEQDLNQLLKNQEDENDDGLNNEIIVSKSQTQRPSKLSKINSSNQEESETKSEKIRREIRDQFEVDDIVQEEDGKKPDIIMKQVDMAVEKGDVNIHIQRLNTSSTNGEVVEKQNSIKYEEQKSPVKITAKLSKNSINSFVKNKIVQKLGINVKNQGRFQVSPKENNLKNQVRDKITQKLSNQYVQDESKVIKEVDLVDNDANNRENVSPDKSQNIPNNNSKNQSSRRSSHKPKTKNVNKSVSPANQASRKNIAPANQGSKNNVSSNKSK